MPAAALQAGRTGPTACRPRDSRLEQACMLWSRASARPGVTPHGRLGRAAVVCSSGAAPFFDPSSHNSIEWLQQQQQQQLLRQPPQQLAGIASARAGAVSMAQESASQESDLLWAGYSALEEQLVRAHKRHEALAAQVQELQAKLHAAQQAGPPPSAWQAATFLLMFLGVVNFMGLLVNVHCGWFVPFWAQSKASAGALWLKQLMNVVQPVTNTVVVLTFCIQALKAAWLCVRW